VTSNAAPDEVPVIALRRDVENTGRADLVGRVLVPIEHTNSAPLVHLYHQGHGEMLDHMLITRNPLANHRSLENHNEMGGRMDVSDLVVQDIIRHDRGPQADRLPRRVPAEPLSQLEANEQANSGDP
jgi:hypothetical protein